MKKAKHGYIITLALQSRGTCYMLAIIQKIRQNVLLIYLPPVRQWTMDTGNFTNSECTCFKKGE